MQRLEAYNCVVSIEKDYNVLRVAKPLDPNMHVGQCPNPLQVSNYLYPVLYAHLAGPQIIVYLIRRVVRRIVVDIHYVEVRVIQPLHTLKKLLVLVLGC